MQPEMYSLQSLLAKRQMRCMLFLRVSISLMSIQRKLYVRQTVKWYGCWIGQLHKSYRQIILCKKGNYYGNWNCAICSFSRLYSSRRTGARSGGGWRSAHTGRCDGWTFCAQYYDGTYDCQRSTTLH